MQFKKVKGRIQVLAYRGYDKEKKRAIVKMLGSMEAYTFSMSDGLEESMTDDEKEELQSYIKKELQSANERGLYIALSYIDSNLKDAAECIENEILELNEEKANKIYAEIANLTKVMRKAGFKKPVKAKIKPATPISKDQLSLYGGE